jgi:hypothetical protein
MSIFQDYDVEDILLDNPCRIDNVDIYPIKVAKWKKFQKYISYLIMSREHYKITEDQPFLQCIIVNMMQVYNNKEYPQDDNLKLQLINYIFKQLCDMFSIVTRTTITYENNSELGDCFVNHDKKILIHEKNFDTIRQVILKQNILFEPIIYKSKLKEKWAQSVARGRAKKNKGLSLAEMISIVREGLKISYEEINELNIFQLYVDFYRHDNTKIYETITLLKTTYGMDWSQFPNTDYKDPIIDRIMRNPELDYFKDFDMNDVVDVMTQK